MKKQLPKQLPLNDDPYELWAEYLPLAFTQTQPQLHKHLSDEIDTDQDAWWLS